MTSANTGWVHLSIDSVREIHTETLARFGGLDGVRDQALLESAVAAPQATFGGESLYASLIDAAAAYLFFVCRNHPFLDGNKRTALGACIVFLRLNGVEPPPDGPAWEELTRVVAQGKISRDDVTKRLQGVLRSR